MKKNKLFDWEIKCTLKYMYTFYVYKHNVNVLFIVKNHKIVSYFYYKLQYH